MKRREERERLVAEADDIVRASVRDMILGGGIPGDWAGSENPCSIRYSPPRAASEIPSVKSDSLSWTIEQRQEIDQALEAVWKPTIDGLPDPAPGGGTQFHQGIDQGWIWKLESSGTPYIVLAPALLYMAHPQWLGKATDPLDEHTRYYCPLDVDRHIQLWNDAASGRGAHLFTLQHEQPEQYLPDSFEFWHSFLEKRTGQSWRGRSTNS